MQFFKSKAVKVLGVLAMLMLALALVTACSGNGDDDTTASPSPTPTANVGGTPTAPPVTPVDPATPPRVIRVVSWYLPNFMGSLYHDERPVEGDVSDYEIALMQWYNRLAVEERFNVRFERINSGEYEDHRDMFISGQIMGAPIGDIVELAPSMMGPAFTGGHLHDMNALNVSGSDMQGAQRWSRPSFEFAGGMWAMTNHAPRVQSFYLAFNEELGQRLGIPDPVAMYEAGNWTWDAMLSMMRTAQLQGYFGLSGTAQELVGLVVASNNGRLATDDFQFAFNSPNTLEALEFLAQIYDERLMWYDAENPMLYDWWVNTVAFFTEQNVLFAATEAWVPNMVGGDAGELVYRVLPFPQGPQGVGYAGLEGFDGGWVIPQGVEDPEFVLQVMEALNAWPGNDTWLVTEGAVWFRGYLFDEASVQRAVDIADNRRVFCPGWAADLRQLAQEVGFDIFDGVRTVAEAVEYRRGPAQEIGRAHV